MKAPPLQLQNRFKELNNYDALEQVATGSNYVTSLKGVSSIKKYGVDKKLTCLIPCF